LGLVRSGAMDEAWVERTIEDLRGGEVSELVVHPGDGSGPPDADEDHGPAARAKELAAVLSPRVRAAIERRGVRLVSYAELPRGRSRRVPPSPATRGVSSRSPRARSRP